MTYKNIRILLIYYSNYQNCQTAFSDLTWFWWILLVLPLLLAVFTLDFIMKSFLGLRMFVAGLFRLLIFVMGFLTSSVFLYYIYLLILAPWILANLRIFCCLLLKVPRKLVFGIGDLIGWFLYIRSNPPTCSSVSLNLDYSIFTISTYPLSTKCHQGYPFSSRDHKLY